MGDSADPTHHGGITCEIERCCDCSNHQYCTNHSEAKYEEYAAKIQAAVEAKVSNGNALQFVVNPGPRAMGTIFFFFFALWSWKESESDGWRCCRILVQDSSTGC